MISPTEAVERIEQRFPQLSEDLHDDIAEGLIHLQVAEFRRLAQSYIDSKDEAGFARVCGLFLELFENGAPELVNALNVSFLEHMNFDNGKVARRWAYAAMPKKMQVAFDEMEDYNRRLHESG